MESNINCNHSKKIITDPIKRVDGSIYRLHICTKCGQRHFAEIKQKSINYCIIM
jgi:hypothetical protein